MPRVIPPAVSSFVEVASSDSGSDLVPFWLSDSEGIPEEGMYLLASELDLPNTAELLAQLPQGYKVVFNIFNWEQSRAGEGFATGIDNSGVGLVAAAAEAYELVGMSEEASALHRVLDQYTQTPSDYEALNGAYEGKPNPYRDDWVRIPQVVRILCAGADRYFYTDAEA
jgi:hypothetical protein